MHTFVKVCGITDAAVLAELPEGSAAGFLVEVPSSVRSLSVEAASKLVEKLPPGAEAWAVVADPPAALIHQLFDEAGVDRIQVYGSIPPDIEFLELHHLVPSLPLPPAGVPGPDPKVPPAEDFSRLHLDVVGTPWIEGSVVQADWEVAHRLVETQPGRKLVLAGGLTAQTIGAALAEVGPWGVDVCAGVESAPGVKDLDKVRAFLKAVDAFESGSVDPA
jgi:phosphoribosylanthranilate isomerase